MSARARWILLLVLALLLRGVAAAHAPSPAMPRWSATMAAQAHDCQPQPQDDGSAQAQAPAGAPGDGQHASPQCKIACDLLSGAWLSAAPDGKASQAVELRVPVAHPLRLLDAPPPDRPPPIG